MTEWGRQTFYLAHAPMSCLFCTELMVTHVHCSADLHCLGMHGKQMVVTLADLMAPKATGQIIHHLPTVVYLIFHVM